MISLLKKVCCFFTLTIVSLGSTPKTALAETPARGPTELYDLQGATAAYAGGGTALTTDLSAVDANPAGLTLGKTSPGYFVSSELMWTHSNLKTLEIGVLDNSSSELAAGIKVRRTSQVTGTKAYRASIGASEQIGTIPLFFGLAGDLDLYEKPVSDAERERNYRVRGGLIYQLFPSFLIGVRTAGWFDRATGAPKNHAVGISWGFARMGAIAGDVEFLESKLSAYIGSLAVAPREWLDVQAGYGYEVEASRQRVSGSVALHSEKFRLSYSIVKPSDTSLALRHLVGFSYNVLAVDKD